MSRHRVIASGIFAGALALVLLAGCGKRGPLYLPGDKDEAETATQPESREQNPSPDSSGY